MIEVMEIETARTTDTLVAKVYLNTSTDEHGRSLGTMDGYRADHTFRLGGQYSIPELLVQWSSSEKGMMRLAEHVFEVFSVGNDPEFYPVAIPEIVEYFAAGNRCISVGDLILIGETALAVASVGFRVVALPDSIRNQVQL